uniref:Uncharacterized protein n=1 Tax=Triticum urartu TaxID=4572 RepID=A0A8R7R8Q3_TRIUA
MAPQAIASFSGILSNTSLALAISPHLTYISTAAVATNTLPATPSACAALHTASPVPKSATRAHAVRTRTTVKLSGRIPLANASLATATASPTRPAFMYAVMSAVQETVLGQRISSNTLRAWSTRSHFA